MKNLQIFGNERGMDVAVIASNLKIEAPMEVCDEIADALGQRYKDPKAVQRELKARGLFPGNSLFDHPKYREDLIASLRSVGRLEQTLLNEGRYDILKEVQERERRGEHFGDRDS